jgi:PKD repeat protein
MLRIVFLMLYATTWAYSQCPIADFVAPTSVCKLADIGPKATLTDAASFSWDFCDGSIMNAPQATFAQASSIALEPYDIKTIEVNGEYFAFVINYRDGKLLRFDFGNSFENNPVQTDLGNFGMIALPLGIGLYKEANLHYALVSTEAGKLFRLSFGSSITSVPVATEILVLAPNHRHMRFTKEAGNTLVMMAGGSSLTILNFGATITNVPTQNSIVIPGATSIIDIDISNECSGKYVVVSAYSTGLHVIDFGASFFNPPAFSQPAGLGLSNSLALTIVKSRDNYHVFVSTEPTGFYRIDFGNSLENPTPGKVALGNFALNTTVAHTLATAGSTYYSLSMNYYDKILSVLKFPKDCALTGNYANELEPENITYLEQGTYSITLTAKGANDETVTQTKSIIVNNQVAPALLIQESGNCVTNGIVFTGLDQSGDALSSLLWDFGDGMSDTGQNPEHVYASSGVYDVVLTATGANTCVNRLKKSLSVFDEPVPDFTIPLANPLCSNQDYLFTNTSVDDPGYSTQWEWSVNGLVVSVTEHLTYAFLTTSTQEIKLKASIPGCESEMIKNISTLVEGPITDFSFSGQCEDENVTFTNNSSGDGYWWDFDDGQNSTSANPAHAFSAIGVYDVTLTASNTVTGCNNTKTKSVSIYSKPQVNFLLSPPPFSCNGTPSQFNDLTPSPPDSNIAGWAWNFGDPGSSQNTSTIKNPTHTYANAGVYTVSLTVSTNFLCSSSLQSPVTISQTPTANFTSAATCEDVPVNFSGTSTGTITAWSWTIGSTAYSSQNPVHTFINAGNTSATLNATAGNGCIGSVTKPIIVPVKLTPDFSVTKNCVNQQTTFTDITNATPDPLSSQQWNFGGLGTGAGSPVNFTFPTTGNVNVVLTSTTQAGCIYTTPKLISIIASPQASFTPSPNVGAPPLAVQFTNTSTNATSYLWAFRDQNNTTSTATSPSFVYQNMGEYQAELTAFNAQNCSHTTGRTISVVIPVVNVALNGLELIQFQNGLKPAITIFNQGNVPVTNLPLLLDISGQVIRERVSATINPSTSYRYVFSFEFPLSTSVDYFCVEAEVTDVTPNDNEACLSMEQSFITFAPYPNPSKGSFHLEWIAKEAGTVNLTVMNGMGQEQQNLQIESGEGLNPVTIETTGLSAGIYFVKIKFQGFTKVYRVFVSE